MLAAPLFIVILASLVAGAVNHYHRNPGFGEIRLLGQIVSYAFALGVAGICWYVFNNFSKYDPSIITIVIVPTAIIGLVVHKIFQYAYRKADSKRQPVVLCSNCGEKVRPIRNKVNHCLNWLMALFTSGFWIFIWYGVMLKKSKSWKCPACGYISR
ncbi:hypothetical protein [Maridesulfovibrio sp.]|uniref:hypothetical protein n=1 Tax=unclassified Maridesulfovibrio TaxID=2794999 RepID=UPI003B003AF6